MAVPSTVLTRMERLKLLHDLEEMEKSVQVHIKKDIETRKESCERLENEVRNRVDKSELLAKRLEHRLLVLKDKNGKQLRKLHSETLRRVLHVRCLAETPLFETQLELCIHTSLSFGHLEHLKWRSCVRSLLIEARDELMVGEEQSEDKKEVFLDAAGMVGCLIQDLNSFTPGRFARRLQEIMDYVKGKDQLTSESNVSSVDHSKLPRSKRTEEAHPAQTIAQNAHSTTKLAVSTLDLEQTHSRKRSRFTRPALRNESIAEEFRHLQYTCRNGTNPRTRAKDIQRLMILCTKHGNASIALRIYDWCVELGFTCDLLFFQRLVLACIRDRSIHGGIGKAHSMLSEMKRKGMKPTASLYHMLISGCQHTKGWRRALLLLRDMGRDRILPTTATYTAVLKVCARANTEDAPMVYDACKFLGVPETIAYAAAARVIQT